MKKRDSKLGFTLAEVLITLGIIGVVAAMTIPTLVQNAQEKAYVTSLKKSFSILSQAYTMSVNDNGTPDEWGLTSGAMLDKLTPYLQISKNCTDGSGNCYPSGVTYQVIQGGDFWMPINTWPQIILADGTFIFSQLTFGATCSTARGTSAMLQNACGEYWIDVNGAKKPNQFGKDMFELYLTKDGIAPEGSSSETSNTFASVCALDGTRYGWGCAAWVIYNGNEDYTKCSGLSWNGKSKCD